MSETVRAKDIDTIFLVPYTCANPGYCRQMHMIGAVKQVEGDNTNELTESKTGYFDSDDIFFSGQNNACGPVDFIQALQKKDNLPLI